MDFRISLSVTLFAFYLISCGRGESSGTIGNKLMSKTALYSSYGVQPKFTFVYDEATSRIIKIDLSNFGIVSFYDSSEKYQEHSVAAPPSGNFVIDFSKRHLDVIRSDGSRSSKPFNFQGTPISAAFNPNKGVFVMQDDLQSIGMMTLTESGDISSSWLSGSLVSSGQSILAGDIDQNGKFVVAVSDKSILVVDVAATIQQRAWNKSSYSTSIDSINWIAPDTSNSSKSLVVSSSSISIFDSTTGLLTESKTLAELGSVIVAKSKASKAHVIVENLSNGQRTAYSISKDGLLVGMEIPSILIKKSADSYLTSDGTLLTIVDTSDVKSQRLMQVRLSDNLVTLEKSFETKGEILVNESMAFINRKSDLGFLELFKFSDSSTKELKAFNLDYFRNN